MVSKIKRWLGSVGVIAGTFLATGTAHAQVDTSAIADDVALGVASGTETVGTFISANIASLLILAAVVIGVLLIIRLFRRVAR